MHGALLKTVSLFILVLSVIGFAGTYALASELGLIGGALGGGISGLLAYFGSSLFKRGKQRIAFERQETALQDPRPPVLYLRAFKDDEIMSRSLDTSHAVLSNYSIVTEEERLSRVFNKIGPFIAIGKPGEQLPSLGAVRQYVDNEDWKNEVRDLINRAKLVVIRAGYTENLMWELQLAMDLIPPERLVLLVPNDSDVYDNFCSEVSEITPSELPPFVEAKINLGSSTVGVISFDEDWNPEYTPFGLQSLSVWRSTKQAPYIVGLQPVFDQIGVEWNPPPLNLGFITIVTLVTFFLGFIIFAVVSPDI